MSDTRQWFLYIIECRDKKLYTGIALDVEKRVREHNKGTACRFTKYRWPVKFMFTEGWPDKSSARKREMEIKKFKRSEKIELINKGPSAPRKLGASGSNFTS
jgi:putative endonuclease